ncbi:hypothetical protein LINPERPRIM_LOCUS21839 [Linum perenne]
MKETRRPTILRLLAIDVTQGFISFLTLT